MAVRTQDVWRDEDPRSPHAARLDVIRGSGIALVVAALALALALAAGGSAATGLGVAFAAGVPLAPTLSWALLLRRRVLATTAAAAAARTATAVAAAAPPTPSPGADGDGDVSTGVTGVDLARPTSTVSVVPADGSGEVVVPVVMTGSVVSAAEPRLGVMPPTLLTLAAGLVRIRHELGSHQSRLRRAAETGKLWAYAEQLPADEEWRRVRDPLSTGALADVGLYAVIAEAYAETGRLARVNALRLLGGGATEVVGSDRLPEALRAVDQACADLDVLLEIAAERTTWSAADLATPPPAYVVPPRLRAGSRLVLDLRGPVADPPVAARRPVVVSAPAPAGSART